MGSSQGKLRAALAKIAELEAQAAGTAAIPGRQQDVHVMTESLSAAATVLGHIRTERMAAEAVVAGKEASLATSQWQGCCDVHIR